MKVTLAIGGATNLAQGAFEIPVGLEVPHLLNFAIEYAVSGEVELVVADLPWWDVSFSLESDYSENFRGHSAFVGIDGPRQENSLFDLIFMPTFSTGEVSSSSRAQIMSGWDCFLLPNRIAERVSPEKESIIVMTGGSDARGLGRSWPNLLDSLLPAGSHVIWVQGPLADEPNLPPTPRVFFEVIMSPTNMKAIYQRASFGLSIHGLSFFEMVASGIPAVTYSPYGQKDRRELAQLREFDVCEIGSSPKDAVDKLVELMAVKKRANQVSQNSRRLFSKRGEHTLVRAISDLLGLR